MPRIEPKGGPTSLPADTTAGHRGIPARREGEGGTSDLTDGAKEMDSADSEGADVPIGTNVRGGPTSGRFYERSLTRRKPTSGDGSGQ